MKIIERMSGSKENRIGINPSPYEYNKLYKGQYNGLKYIIQYNKIYEDEYGESNYSITINWIDYIDPDREQIVNQAISKIFKLKIDQGLIIKD